MQRTTHAPTITHPDQALLFDRDERSVVRRQIKDRRGEQGRQDPLAQILLIGILANPAGQDASL